MKHLLIVVSKISYLFMGGGGCVCVCVCGGGGGVYSHTKRSTIDEGSVTSKWSGKTKGHKHILDGMQNEWVQSHPKRSARKMETFTS